ncbi:site-specific integrase [Salmonella enterica]|nr:tyrosine-type recombinase/integrase [Salmonella enterica]EEF4028728.1 tyrosine-type recombinase/integrase [Salmonella enterica]EEJ5984735.1 site-specific integrase [Salmonella enterica]EEL9687437.1 tyrosine-type recombinase/integrase [Salmonella enterica]EEU3910114.1 site-specific integrase [Salmonella enterica]
MTTITGIHKFTMISGERRCIIVDNENKIPLYYPNLYLTIQYRNRGWSFSTMESVALSISLLYRFLRENNISIEHNILAGQCLSNSEIESLSIYLMKKRSRHEPIEPISTRTLYHRLNTLIGYFSWLSDTILRFDASEQRACANRMVRTIKQRLPVNSKNKNKKYTNDGLSQNVQERILEVINPRSAKNPFEPYVRQRNELMILLLYHLGVRCGELLNIKLEDIDFQKNRILITRRPDEKDDPRLNQPLVKTYGRTLSLERDLALKIHDYISFDRHKVSSSKKGYLFLSYKPGPSRGLPISKSGYHKIIAQIASCDPLLHSLKGHQLRHTWNYNFSNLMDSLPVSISEEEQGRMREQQMGWKENSGTTAIYNKRFIREKTDEASLRLQERLNTARRKNDNNK